MTRIKLGSKMIDCSPEEATTKFVAKHGGVFYFSVYAARVERYLNENTNRPELIPVEVCSGGRWPAEVEFWQGEGYTFTNLDLTEEAV